MEYLNKIWAKIYLLNYNQPYMLATYIMLTLIGILLIVSSI